MGRVCLLYWASRIFDKRVQLQTPYITLHNLNLYFEIQSKWKIRKAKKAEKTKKFR